MEVIRIGDDAAPRSQPFEGLEDLYRAHARGATRLAYVLSGDEETAQDIAHEAFVRVGRKLVRLRSPDHARAYLYKTIVNLCRGRWRRQKAERAATARLDRARVQQPPDHGGRDETWDALLGLPVRQRSALYFRYYEDLSESQAADALGCSVSALKSLVNRGLRELRAELGGDDDD